MAKNIYDLPTDDEDDPHVQITPLANVKSYRRHKMPPKASYPRSGASKDKRIVPDSQSENERPSASSRLSDSQVLDSLATRPGDEDELPSSPPKSKRAESPRQELAEESGGNINRADRKGARIVVELPQEGAPRLAQRSGRCSATENITHLPR